MIFGLNQYFVILCDKCNSGLGLLEAMTKNQASDLSDEYKCSCGNTYSYINGLLNDFCSDHFASVYNFISNIFYHGVCKITIGSTFVIELKKEVPIINKVFLTPQSGVVHVEPKIINDKKSIKIISSEVTDNIEFLKDSIKKVGEQVEIAWMLYGKTMDLKIEPWRQLLIEAKEQLINKKYLLSYFSSATALESYLNARFSDLLSEKGIAEQGIDIFLKESTMPDKLFKLSGALLNFPITNLTISKKELEKIIMKRNKIAHGKLVDLDKEDADNVFRNALKSIFEFEMKK